ncbi:MAG TPA: STAS domain-containing protein [bacterium]|nr:STAS domain-containing protein [bacterium]
MASALRFYEHVLDKRNLNSTVRKMVTALASFSVKTQLCSQILIISAGGYLNKTAGAQIAEAAAQPQFASISKVVLVVEGVQAANSVGISYLLQLLETLKSRQGGLALVRANPSLLRSLGIMGLFSHAFKAESVREALDLLSP